MNRWPIEYYSVSLFRSDGECISTHYFRDGREAMNYAHSLLGNREQFIRVFRIHNYRFDCESEEMEGSSIDLEKTSYYRTDCGLDVVYKQDLL